MNLNSDSNHIFFISIAGALMQILLFFVVIILYNKSLISALTYNIFLKYNTIIIIFNMLPIYPLDGNKILSSLLEMAISFKLSLKLSNLFSLISLVIFCYFNYIYKLGSYPIIFFLLFKTTFYIKQYKQIWNKFLIERMLIENKNKKIKNIKEIKSLYKNRFNFINGINEQKYLLKKFHN